MWADAREMSVREEKEQNVSSSDFCQDAGIFFSDLLSDLLDNASRFIKKHFSCTLHAYAGDRGDL